MSNPQLARPAAVAVLPLLVTAACGGHAASRTLGGDGWIAWQDDGSLTVARLDGSQRSHPFADGAGQSDWSPGGRRLACRIDLPDGTSDLFVADRDGANVRLPMDSAAPGEGLRSRVWVAP